MCKKYHLKYKNEKHGHFEIHPFKVMLIDIRRGLFAYHYPLCCITQFCIETILLIPSYIKRADEFGADNIEDNRHIPCNICMRKIIGEKNEKSNPNIC